MPHSSTSAVLQQLPTQPPADDCKHIPLMDLYEQLHLKTIPPASLPAMSECFSPEDEEFLFQISVDCELDDILLTDSIDWHALDVESSISTSDNQRRKRTYELRKEEINALDKKAKILSTQLEDLKRQAGIQDEQSIAQQQLNNHMLREMLRNQQLLIASFRSVTSADSSETVLSSLSSRIHLESDLAGRRKLLRDIKFQKIHDARRFIERRTGYSPMTSRFSESIIHRTGDGETIAVRFDIAPLPEDKSVKQVFSAIMHCFAHLDICMTEMLGNVTMREENAERESRENKKRDIVQHRFVNTNQHDIQIENNSVQFSEYTKNHRCARTGVLREDAIVTTDFVDQDDIFPYSHKRGSGRTSQAPCTFSPASAPAKPRASRRSALVQAPVVVLGGSSTSLVDGMQQDDTQDACDKQVVVLTMWFQTNMRHCEFQILEAQMQELVEDSDRVREAVLKCVRASLRSDQMN